MRIKLYNDMVSCNLAKWMSDEYLNGNIIKAKKLLKIINKRGFNIDYDYLNEWINDYDNDIVCDINIHYLLRDY